jgi:hypothetical protein
MDWDLWPLLIKAERPRPIPQWVLGLERLMREVVTRTAMTYEEAAQAFGKLARPD